MNDEEEENEWRGKKMINGEGRLLITSEGNEWWGKKKINDASEEN